VPLLISINCAEYNRCGVCPLSFGSDKYCAFLEFYNTIECTGECSTCLIRYKCLTDDYKKINKIYLSLDNYLEYLEWLCDEST